MATAENLEDIFECAVCLNYMMDRNPRLLACHHTFCEQCLTQILKNRKISCPTCKTITELQNNDVQELKINFMLHKVKGLVTKPEGGKKENNKDTDKKSSKSLCQICGERPPVYKCKDCPQLMCQSCKNAHSDMFEGHAVFNMCDKHEDSITHLCKKCILPLCMKCGVLDHMKHKTHFVDYTKGVQNIQDEVKALHSSIKMEISNMDSYLKQSTSTHVVTMKMKQGLAARRQYHNDQINEVDRLINGVNENTEQYEQIQKECCDTQNQCNIRAASLKALTIDTPGFFVKYSQLKPRAEQVLSDVKKQLQVKYNPPPFVLREYQQKPIADVITIQPGLKKLMKEKLLVDIPASDDINCQKQIAFIGTDVVLVTYKDPQHVIRLNPEGCVVDRYYPEMKGEAVRGVNVHDDKIYIVQEKAIAVLSQRSDTNTVYKPDTYRNNKILVIDKSTFFISDFYRPGGKIYKYNTESKKTEVVVEGLMGPYYMSVMNTREGPRYIVTEYNTDKILIYNQNWKLLTTSGGQGSGDKELRCPHATAVTETGILVADRDNNRISHYSMEGEFLCHVITDDLYKPIGMAYKYPYLWVCRDNDYVKCFKVKYQ